MPSRPKNASSVEPKVAGTSPATTCSQPWWHGTGYTTISPAALSQSSSKSSSLEIPNGGAGNKAGSSQADVDMDKVAAVSKDMQTTTTQSGYFLKLISFFISPLVVHIIKIGSNIYNKMSSKLEKNCFL